MSWKNFCIGQIFLAPEIKRNHTDIRDIWPVRVVLGFQTKVTFGVALQCLSVGRPGTTRSAARGLAGAGACRGTARPWHRGPPCRGGPWTCYAPAPPPLAHRTAPSARPAPACLMAATPATKITPASSQVPNLAFTLLFCFFILKSRLNVSYVLKQNYICAKKNP